MSVTIYFCKTEVVWQYHKLVIKQYVNYIKFKVILKKYVNTYGVLCDSKCFNPCMDLKHEYTFEMAIKLGLEERRKVTVI